MRLAELEAEPDRQPRQRKVLKKRKLHLKNFGLLVVGRFHLETIDQKLLNFSLLFTDRRMQNHIAMSKKLRDPDRDLLRRVRFAGHAVLKSQLLPHNLRLRSLIFASSRSYLNIVIFGKNTNSNRTVRLQRTCTESTYFGRVLCWLPGSPLKAAVRNVLKASILILCCNLSACQSTDSLTLFNYGKIPNPGATAPSDPLVPPAVSDGLAINYANSIEIIMRCNATKSRITREVSATAQVGLAAFGGLGAAYNWSKTTLTVLGLGSAAIPQLQGIFDAKGRAEVYNQAANMIRDGIWEYYSLNSSPSASILTSNGLTLVKKVSAAISLVDTTLIGQLPSATQMRQAVEVMTPAGTTKQVAGAAPTNAMVPAALQRAPTAPQTLTSNEWDRLQAELKRVKTEQATTVDFVADLRALHRGPGTVEQKQSAYTAIVARTKSPSLQPNPDDINFYYQNTATPDETAAMRAELKRQLNLLKGP